MNEKPIVQSEWQTPSGWIKVPCDCPLQPTPPSPPLPSPPSPLLTIIPRTRTALVILPTTPPPPPPPRCSPVRDQHLRLIYWGSKLLFLNRPHRALGNMLRKCLFTVMCNLIIIIVLLLLPQRRRKRKRPEMHRVMLLSHLYLANHDVGGLCNQLGLNLFILFCCRYQMLLQSQRF